MQNLTITSSNASTSSSSSDSVFASNIVEEEDAECTQLFEKLKNAERQRINKLEELERKADLQLERQLVMASCWSRALLIMRGKLKGTEWDPENSHKIDFCDFMELLNSNNVQFMEYSNYGQTISDIKSICSQPNMRYTEFSGKVFLRKSDYINSIVRACASSAKFEALCDEYMHFSVEKCASVLREFHSSVETITDILLEKGEIKAEEIWGIYNRAPRISQVVFDPRNDIYRENLKAKEFLSLGLDNYYSIMLVDLASPTVNPVDENGALIYAGRWGIHGITLPGRVTFAPGNAGFSAFVHHLPWRQTQTVTDETWKLIDNIWDKRVEEIKAEASMEVEEEKEKPQLLMASHFL